jgi:HEAT repeat protein
VHASSSEVATFTTDAALVVTSWPPAIVALSGIPEPEAKGRPLQQVIPSLIERGLLRRFHEVLASGSVHVFSPGIHHYLLPCRPATPSRRFTHMQQRATVGPLRVGDRIEGVIVAIDDVTARVEAERDLAESLSGSDETWNARRAAVQRAAEAVPSDFAESLVGVLGTHHLDFNVLSSALELLAGTGVDASEALGELLQDEDADLRIQAALALGRQGGAVAVGRLIAALRDSHINVRFQAIESLGQLRASEAVPALIDIAEGDEPFLAFAAVTALGMIGDTRVAPRLAALLARDDLRPAVIDALSRFAGETTVDALAGVLSVKELMTAIEMVDQEQSASLIRVLGWTEGPDAQSALIDLLSRPNHRTYAVEALVRHGDSVVDRLLPYLNAEDEDTRHAVVACLGGIGSRTATDALMAIPAGSSLSAAAAGALGRIGDPAAFEHLMGLLAHSDAAVRRAAVGALNAIGHPGMAARIVEMLDSKDAATLESAVRIAGYFGYPAARERLLSLAADASGLVRCAALEQLPFVAADESAEVLVTALQGDDAEVRVAAVKALGRVDDSAACAALIDALRDPDLWVRYFAVRSLAAQRAPSATTALERLALTDPSPPVRIAAIEALVEIGQDGSRAVLIGLTSAEPLEVAAAAMTALEQLDRARDAV